MKNPVFTESMQIKYYYTHCFPVKFQVLKNTISDYNLVFWKKILSWGKCEKKKLIKKQLYYRQYIEIKLFKQ